jgi:AraC family transcriptional regulator, regulatory protein of adaptative response / DNA-3-methyladenine glycosylase II
LGKRAIGGVEAIDGERYLRTVAIGKHSGWIAVAPSKHKHTLRVELAASLAPALVPTLARVKRLFDLAADPQQIAAQLGPLAADRPGLRVPGAFNGFELAVRAVLGQQISVPAATTLAGRFAAAFGDPIRTPHAQLTHLAPTTGRIAQAAPEELTTLGITTARARTIVALAEAIATRQIVLEPGVDYTATVAKLRESPGIGEWTAQYIAMRALAWPDAFPHTDLGIFKALGTTNPKQVLQIAEAWRPWRAYAAIHLWQRLETRS